MKRTYRSVFFGLLIVPLSAAWSQGDPASDSIKSQTPETSTRIQASDTDTFREIRRIYADCNRSVRNAIEAFHCHLAVLRAIGERQWSDPSVIKSTRKYMDDTFERLSRTYNGITSREHIKEVRGDYAKAKSYMSSFSQAHAPTIETISSDGYLDEDGHRVFLIPDSEESDSLSRTLHLLRWANQQTNFGFNCVRKNKTPAGWCEIRLMKSDGAVAERYVVSVSRSDSRLVFQKGFRPWVNWFPQLTNLAAGDLETFSLQQNYKSSIQPIIFWFGQHYAGQCQVKNPRTIAGTVATVYTQSNTVKDARSYEYVVESELYPLAREYHDKHVNYQVIGAYAFSEAQKSMREFFRSSSCESEAVQNVRTALRFFAENWEKIPFHSIISNDQRIIPTENKTY